MSNTYTQIYIHAVFTVKNRRSLIKPEWKDELNDYISGIIEKRGHKMLAVNGIPDHIHIFFGLRPVQSLSDLIKEVKEGSSRWINQRNLVVGRFSWQGGRIPDFPAIVRSRL